MQVVQWRETRDRENPIHNKKNADIGIMDDEGYPASRARELTKVIDTHLRTEAYKVSHLVS